MVWKEATDCCTGTAAIYGAPDLVKISQLFSDTDVSDTVTIHEAVQWTFQSNACTGASFRISNPAQTVNYVIDSAAIVAQRVITLPLLVGDDIFVTAAFCQDLTNKTYDLGCNTLTGTPVEFNNALQCDTFSYISDNLSVFAETTSAQLLGIISDETGMCLLVFNTSPTLVTPALGTPSALVLTCATGLPFSGLANNTSGELITWDACCVSANVAAGACGQVLTSNGACMEPTFQCAGAADNLGNHTATCCLVMGTNAITFGVDAAAPAACVSYVTFVAAGPLYNAISCDIHNFTINAVSMFTIAPCVINTPCGVFQEGGLDISPIGTHTQWIPAGSWGTVTTNGAEFAELELGTNCIMLQTFNFDTTTSEKIQFWWEPPAEWNAGTITFNTKWTAGGGCACETFILSLTGRSMTNSDAIDAAFCGTAATTTDALITVNDMHISPESTAVTIEGATKGEVVLLQLSRTISDTLSVDAKLIGINITYTTDEATAT